MKHTKQVKQPKNMKKSTLAEIADTAGVRPKPTPSHMPSHHHPPPPPPPPTVPVVEEPVIPTEMDIAPGLTEQVYYSEELTSINHTDKTGKTIQCNGKQVIAKAIKEDTDARDILLGDLEPAHVEERVAVLEGGMEIVSNDVEKLKKEVEDDKPTPGGGLIPRVSYLETTVGTDAESGLQKAVADAASAATTAQSTAEAAQSTANTANTTATNAASAASTAQSTAEAAQSTATNAASAATTAQSTAEAAQTTANTASTTATNAASAASTAQSTAEAAQSTADTANSTANRLDAQINTTTTDFTCINDELHGNDTIEGLIAKVNRLEDTMFKYYKVNGLTLPTGAPDNYGVYTWLYGEPSSENDMEVDEDGQRVANGGIIEEMKKRML